LCSEVLVVIAFMGRSWGAFSPAHQISPMALCLFQTFRPTTEKITSVRNVPLKRFALSLALLRPRGRNRVDDGKFLGTKTGCCRGKIPFSIVKQACREFRRKDQSCLSLRKGVRSTSGIAIRVLHIRTRLPQCPVLQFPRLGGRMHIYYEWSEAKHADNTS